MIRKMTIVVVVMLLFVNASHNAFGGEAILIWDYPTTNTDGTTILDLGGFKVYYGTGSGSYTATIDIGMATPYTASCSVQNCGTFTVTNLSDGNYYFVATAYDTAGNESDYSNEVLKTISGAPPASIPAPTGIQVTASGGTVTVSWDKPNSSSIAGYQIQRGTTAVLFNATYDVGLGYASSTPCVVSYTGCTRRQFIFNGVTPGTYFWRVTAYASSGIFGEASSAASITISSDVIIPADVTNFSAVKYSTGTRLSWTNPSDPDFYGLLLEYSFNNSAGPWVLLANLRGIPGTNQTADHLNLSAGTYYYRIHTKDTSGNVTSTEYTSVELKQMLPPLPQESYPVAITDFKAEPNKFQKYIDLSWVWPDNPYIISAIVKYRLKPYTNFALLGEVVRQEGQWGWVWHYYSDYLIEKDVEYLLIIRDDSGREANQAKTSAIIPKTLEAPPCECGGGGVDSVFMDNAATDFPKPQPKREKESDSGFGCGTIKNIKPPDDGSTDVSVVAIAATVMLFIARRKLRPRIN